MLPVAVLMLVVASEPTVGERIARGRAAFDALDFDIAALELGQAARDPLATEAQRLEANLWAGAAHRVLGNDTDARLHFIFVLRRDPAYPAPPEFAPKISDFYALVREEIVGAPPLPAAVAPPAPMPVGALTAVGGGLVATLGGVAVVVGAQPFFAHDAARARLLQAATTGEDGTAAADAQSAARSAWESWGGPLVVGGALAATVGVVGAALGGLWWAGGS